MDLRMTKQNSLPAQTKYKFNLANRLRQTYIVKKTNIVGPTEAAPNFDPRHRAAAGRKQKVSISNQPARQQKWIANQNNSFVDSHYSDASLVQSLESVNDRFNESKVGS